MGYITQIGKRFLKKKHLSIDTDKLVRGDTNKLLTNIYYSISRVFCRHGTSSHCMYTYRCIGILSLGGKALSLQPHG